MTKTLMRSHDQAKWRPMRAFAQRKKSAPHKQMPIGGRLLWNDLGRMDVVFPGITKELL